MADESMGNKPWLWRPPEGGYIGRRGLRPKEAPEKVSGRAVYTSDVYLPGMLYVKILRSPYTHARIKKMDTLKAESLKGVWAVIRYDDPDIDFTDPYKPVIGRSWFWYRNILPDIADFEGVRLGAMVIAETEANTLEAAQLVGMRDLPTRKVELLRAAPPDFPALRLLIQQFSDQLAVNAIPGETPLHRYYTPEVPH